MSSTNETEWPPRRSSGVLKSRRILQPWPEDREFRILSIDGGGIRGIFPAAFLAGLEQRYLRGASVAGYFDLIAGTSTGGIIALGLAAGVTAAELRNLYIDRGGEIFPPLPDNALGQARRRIRAFCRYFKFSYDRDALLRILREKLGDKKFGQASNRLCIPSFDGRYGDVYIFKTPHHLDFKKDAYETMITVGSATAAAPTFFQPFRSGGYTFVDGGVWANNPVMIALVDALSCFAVPRERVRILSLGCGDKPYVVDGMKINLGGIWHWRDVIYAAMRLQSLNVIGQAGLLIGADRLLRVDAPTSEEEIEMDDWIRARSELPPAADSSLDALGEQVAQAFLAKPAAPFEPLIRM